MTPQKEQKERDDARKARAEAKKRKQEAETVGRWIGPTLMIATIGRVVALLVILLFLGVGAYASIRWLLEAVT